MLTILCRADERSQRLLARLAEEASTFEQKAPSLLSEETLRQNALKPNRRFRPRKTQPGPQQWQTREIRSEYLFASVGSPPAIREIRKVTAVDGKPVAESSQALDHLLRVVQANDDRSKRKLLEDFEKHGLIGTVTDFGQVLLLFSARSQDLYEFLYHREALVGAERCAVFRYRQLEGPGALTVWAPKGRQQPSVAGEIWVRAGDYQPVRITLNSMRKEGAATVREEADVSYAMSPHGVLVPLAVSHRQYRNAALTAENLFTYAPFRKFGASAVLTFPASGEENK